MRDKIIDPLMDEIEDCQRRLEKLLLELSQSPDLPVIVSKKRKSLIAIRRRQDICNGILVNIERCDTSGSS